jgi:rRNA maturation RNase YbeY
MPSRVRSRLRRDIVRLPAFARLIERILQATGVPDHEISVEVVGDGRMRRLNCQYRHRDQTTDVLAFAMRDAPGPRSALLGDIVVSLPTAVRQASVRGHSIDTELSTLLVHGMLHLLGYDHERGPREARCMRQQERRVLQALGPAPRLTRQGRRRLA